jgi:tetratricopeptide (TPR) repeat protein
MARDDYLPGEKAGYLVSGWDNPTLPYLHAERGQFRRALGVFDVARTLVTGPVDMIRIETARNRVLLRMGKAEQVLDWARAVRGLSESRRVQSTADNMESRACIAIDSLSQARAALERYPQWYTGGTRAHLGVVNQRQAEIALARGDFETALELLRERPKYGLSPYGGWRTIEWREALARAHHLAGDLAAAAGVHEETLRKFGGHVLSHYDLGKLYEEMGRPEDAEREYAAFLKAWAEADEGLPQPEDARRRLVALQTRHR